MAKAILHELSPVTGADDIAALSCADILNKREQPVVLFTPALLVTHGNLDRDPVMEFNALHPAESADLKPFAVDLRKDREQFFEGLGVAIIPGKPRPINFDKRLYAIDKSRAEECFEFFSSISFSDPRTGFFAQTSSYEIVIPDPTSKLQQTLNVQVFGVVANDFVALLQARPFLPAKAMKLHITPENKSLFLQSRGIVGVFDGIDPLKNRE